jgi:hypothetical protein
MYFLNPVAYNQGFTAMEVAIMFTLYEVAGVVTNLAAGMLGARWGLKTTLLSGLTVQLVGLGMLFGWQNDWAKATVRYIYMVFWSRLRQLVCVKNLLGPMLLTTPSQRKITLHLLLASSFAGHRVRHSLANAVWCGQGSYQAWGQDGDQACDPGGTEFVALQTRVFHHGLEKLSQRRGILFGSCNRVRQVWRCSKYSLIQLYLAVN